MQLPYVNFHIENSSVLGGWNRVSDGCDYRENWKVHPPEEKKEEGGDECEWDEVVGFINLFTHGLHSKSLLNTIEL